MVQVDLLSSVLCFAERWQGHGYANDMYTASRTAVETRCVQRIDWRASGIRPPPVWCPATLRQLAPNNRPDEYRSVNTHPVASHASHVYRFTSVGHSQYKPHCKLRHASATCLRVARSPCFPTLNRPCALRTCAGISPMSRPTMARMPLSQYPISTYTLETTLLR